MTTPRQDKKPTATTATTTAPWLLLVSVLVLGGGVSPCAGATYQDVKALTTSLFSGYKKELSPVFDKGKSALNVFVSLWLSSIQDLDEINQQLTFSALLDMGWTDFNLAWDATQHNGTAYFTYPQQEMWVPDLTIMNTVESLGELGFNRNRLTVYSSGDVTWIVSGVFKTSCDIDVTYYPFDRQQCDIVLTTLVSQKDEIDLDFDQQYSVSLEWYSKSGTWELEALTVNSVGDTSTRSRVAFSITMKRLRLYYVVSILIPVLFLSLTATLVFALPADSGEKMGTSITVLLAFAVYLTIVSEQMPKTSVQVSYLSMYLTLLLGQTALGVLLSVWILNLHHRDDAVPPGPRLTRIARTLQAVICKGTATDKVEPLDLEHELQKKRGAPPSGDVTVMTWVRVAFVVDRFIFYSFTIFLFSVTVIFLSILASA